jgi:hypothetical protein
MNIYGVKNLKPKKEKKKKKKKKRKKKKKATEEENPFLSNVNTDVKNDDENDETKSKKPKAYYHRLDNNYSYSTNYLRSTTAAWNSFNESRSGNIQDNEIAYEAYIPRAVSRVVNSCYGFTPRKNRMKFKILDSKKHPEYKKYQNAMKALKVIFGKMSYNRDLEEIKKDVAPIISYFEGITKKYRQDKKHPRRLRSSAYYNLAQIYYCLDMPEKTIEVGQAMIKMKYKEKSGKKFIKKAKALRELLDFHHTESRHIVNKKADSEEDGNSEEIEETDETDEE